MKKLELLAPVQDFMGLKTAIEAGADAVYFGVKGFNMRAGARNFEVKDLKKIVKIAHTSLPSASQSSTPSLPPLRRAGRQGRRVKAYLTLNTIIYEEEIKKVEKILLAAKKVGVNAVICWDMSVVELAKKIGIPVHLSTQASVANSEAAKFYKSQGVKRIVLARECSLEQIKKIKQTINGIPHSARDRLELEVFIHGAMCVSVSGRCFMSEYLYGKSANRGECLQPCRRKYLIKQIDDGQELELGEDYVLSPKDLCTLPFIEKLIGAGIDCFKIEGRNRSVEYVKTVVEVYRKVIDFWIKIQKTTNNQQKKKLLVEFDKLKKDGLKKLQAVYNRGLGNGFYLGKPLNEWIHSYGSQATEKKIHVGKVTHFYPKISVAEILIQANKTVSQGDTLQIEGQRTGIIRQKVKSMEIDHRQVKKVGQGDKFALHLESVVKANDLVYKIIK